MFCPHTDNIRQDLSWWRPSVT